MGGNNMLLDVKRTEKWIAALEANGHRQIRFNLRDGNNRCALGIINEAEGDLLPMDHPWTEDDFNRLGMSGSLGVNIAAMNDSVYFISGNTFKVHTFTEIANILKIRLRAQQEFIGVIQSKGVGNVPANSTTSITA
jgi:hypothetical protein